MQTQSVQSSTEDKPKVTATKVRKDRVTELQDQVAVLEEKLGTLTNAFIKVATMSGHGNQIKEFGYEMWKPSAKDMSQY